MLSDIQTTTDRCSYLNTCNLGEVYVLTVAPGRGGGGDNAKSELY